MIVDMLLEIEEKLRCAIMIEELNLEAVRSLIQIFRQIDYNSEIVVLSDLGRLQKLAEGLKGEMLTEKEKEMLAQILVRQNRVME